MALPTASTSAEATSPSDYTTPATSLEATPALTDSMSVDEKPKTGSSIEIRLPAMAKASNSRPSRKGTVKNSDATIPDSDDDSDMGFVKPVRVKHTLRNPYRKDSAAADKKGKAAVIPDSDDFDDELAGLHPDEIVARKLQEEEYRLAELSDSDDKPLFKPKDKLPSLKAKSSAPAPAFGGQKRGRPAFASSSSSKRPTKKTKLLQPWTDSDDSMDVSGDFIDLTESLDEDDDDDDFTDDSNNGAYVVKSRPAPSKKSKGKAKETSPPPMLDSDADDTDDWHAPLKPTKKRRLPKPPATGETATMSRPSPLVPLDSDSVQDPWTDDSASEAGLTRAIHNASRNRRGFQGGMTRRALAERARLELHHPELKTMWTDLENTPPINAGRAAQPQNISRQLKGFQLEGLAWMMAMEQTEWKGGLLGDEMGLGKTIQAVSLIMSDFPAKKPTLVLVPPVALMQWTSEIASYTEGALKTFVYHGTNAQSKSMTVKKLKEYHVIMMSYNSLESMYRKQEKGFKRKAGVYKEKSMIHQINFHRIILDEAHCIKTRSTMTAKACFALKTDFRWCLSGTPLQNRIGEFFSLIRFLNVQPFASYFCKSCDCSSLEWNFDDNSRCTGCKHPGMQHVAVFNQELLNPIQKFGSVGPGREAFDKLRLLTNRIMLRRLKKDHSSSMDLPVKEIHVDRQFFGEVENDFANSIMTNSKRKFETYVAQGVLLNNYANIFGLIMQMRQVADHPDLILKKSAEGGQNVLVCCICDETAEDAIRSRCKHDFCRMCAKGYLLSSDTPDCPQCHIPLSIDLEQPDMEQDNMLVKKSSIINRIKMENWTSSSKIEMLVRDLHRLRSDKASHKSIIFSQFTSMLQLIEWRLRRAGLSTVMLDGSMTPAQRQASIEHFMNNPEVECFLVSLKAGGVALNLTEASRVFIVDPWWNPAAEWQSADRCHRIGQTRPCTITRLCIEDSVESRMVLIQEKKTNMINSTVNSDDKAMESLTPQDMQFLFRGS
ncbi:RING-11 protein [Plectosphaerella plurivora]|uniref:RING-11 protein n=1 Tax=Plectosphaerella plurivora TaxID=936078 RepID=A0A9P8VCK7_9PEZI|nr:RING-11 protein [Plectosphaerella plurivora]